MLTRFGNMKTDYRGVCVLNLATCEAVRSSPFKFSGDWKQKLPYPSFHFCWKDVDYTTTGQTFTVALSVF